MKCAIVDFSKVLPGWGGGGSTQGPDIDRTRQQANLHLLLRDIYGMGGGGVLVELP